MFAGGVIVGRYVPVAQQMQKSETSESGVSYKFINPLLFCQDQNINLSNQGASVMENAVGSYITQEKNNGDLIDASFYFRDLNGGPWALVNPDFRSIPSSLLKVPTAISVYQHAEQDPKFLSTKVTFAGGTGLNRSEHFQPREEIQPHTTYTTEDLVRYMLEDSDNEALLLLTNMMDLQELTDSYTHFGIELPQSADKKGYTMTVKTYASFFRILYNGTYLTQSNSEHLLSLLSQSSFIRGLVAGLPQGMAVAHKFGEASLPNGILQLHDCGIVYKPNQPYLICVMTKGTNFDTLAGVISHISETVYQILQNQN
jgi:hypothetical protein